MHSDTLSVMAGTDPALDARQVLESGWVPGVFPVDPVQVARRLGIDVVDATLPQNVSGAIVKKAGEDPRILLNATDSFNRKRFSCAHEIGHFIRRSEEPDAYEYVDLRGTLAAQGQDADEIYANQFAANLLMPEDAIGEMHANGASIIEMMTRFGVSQDAMRYRLMNLGLA